jgi:hypothetical protein
MVALTEAIEAAGEEAAAVIVTTTEDAPSAMRTTIANALDPPNMIATTDQAGDPGAMRTTTAAAIEIEIGTDVARQVPGNMSRARLLSRNLLRMSVTGEPFSSSNLPLVFAQKS